MLKDDGKQRCVAERRDCERQRRRGPGGGPGSATAGERGGACGEGTESRLGTNMLTHLGPDEDNEPRDGTAGLECMMRPTVGLSSTGTSEGEAARLRLWW